MYGLYTCIVIGTTILTCSYAHERDVELAHSRKGVAAAGENGRLPSLHPFLLFRTMLMDPIRQLDFTTLKKSYTVDSSKYYDFYIVTISRTFYYMGISVQTFFLYFVHDIIRVKKDPEAAVALLAILGQCAGALTCFPVGMASDRFFNSRRKPFVYFACAVLASATVYTIFVADMTHMVIACCVLGGANGVYLTMDTSLAVDTLLVIIKTLLEAMVTHSCWAFGVAGFVGSALGPLIGGPLLFAFGRPTLSPEGEVEYSIQGYGVVLCLSASYFLASALVLKRIRNAHV
ncbi:major facilitator superfamily-like protein [Fragilaria crotonensis]|nr:major facilitator superfamily-like protein [Fragilaria crotonensis]